MKKIVTLIAFILISLVSPAQKNYQDVVYLKNGSIIRGVIIEQIPNKSIKMETPDKSIFVYQLDEIEKITKEERVNSNSKQSNDNYFISKGRINNVEISLEPGIGYNVYLDGGERGYKNNSLSVGFHYSCSYMINSNFSAGGFIGLDFNKLYHSIKIPIGADLNAYLFKTRVSPLIFFKPAYYIGYYNDDGKSFIHGFNISTGIGVRTFLSDKKSFLLNIGYCFNTNTWHYFDDPDFRADNDAYYLHAIVIRFGFNF